jgi:hypothetical protein
VSFSGKPFLRETTLVALLLLLVFLANLSIASRSPFGAWMDEVFMDDPGLNLAAGKGWASSTWNYQTDREFWAQNSPLYPAGLSVWARVFGGSMVASRAYCYFLGAVGLFFLWLGSYRLNLLTPGYRLFWLLFLATEYAMNWMMRNARYDVWIFVGLSLAWTGASLKRPAARYALIFVGCFLGPWAGFVSLTYILLLAGLGTVLTGFRAWKEAAAGVAGAVVGMLSVLGFYVLMGVAGSFWRILQGYSVAGTSLRSPAVLEVFLYPREDYGIILLIVALAVLTVLYRRRRRADYARWLGLGWGMILLMPCIMLARGSFTSIYLYMVIIPLSLAILALAARPEQRNAGRMITLAMGLLCLSGLPLRMYFACKEWDYRDPRHIRAFVRAYIKPEDCVCTDYLFYFEVRDYVRWYAIPNYIPITPPDEAKRINVALLADSRFPDVARDPTPLKAIGGGWRKVAVFPPPEMLARSRPRVAASYTLYRRGERSGDPGPTASDADVSVSGWAASRTLSGVKGALRRHGFHNTNQVRSATTQLCEIGAAQVTESSTRKTARNR